MPCPHVILDNSLSIRRLPVPGPRLATPPKSKKMEKTRNFNRRPGDWSGQVSHFGFESRGRLDRIYMIRQD